MSALLVISEIGGQHIALDATRIDAVVDLHRLTPVPRAPRHILGLSAVRSRVVTVIDPLGGRDTQVLLPIRAIVLEVDSHLYAIAVDRVLDAAVFQDKFEPISLPTSSPWRQARPLAVQTAYGTAFLVDPYCLVAGQLALGAFA